MNVKELKEILAHLPDDAQVIVSEKTGRGGHVQEYIVGKLVNDSYVKGRSSNLDNLLKHYQEHKDECDLGIAELTAGTAYREEVTSKDGRPLAVWKSKDGTPFQYFRRGDEWSVEEMIRIFKYNSDEDAKAIDDIKKSMGQRLKKVEAIELSCNF